VDEKLYSPIPGPSRSFRVGKLDTRGDARKTKKKGEEGIPCTRRKKSYQYEQEGG